MADYPLIQGKEPHSWPEVYFANALLKNKIDFYFQYLIGRNRGLRGAIVVDFVIRRPFYQPIEIYGEYWHKGQLGADDRLKLAIEASYFGRETIVIWATELESQEEADMYVKTKIL